MSAVEPRLRLGRTTPVEVAAAAQLACLLEASAPKPGNVSPGRRFADVGFEHFLASAVAIGEPLAGAGARPLGSTLRQAVEATARWAGSNTNLGMLLLLVPLARAALRQTTDAAATEPDGLPGLRLALERTLEDTTVEDAREVYEAIRLAAPGGLGQVEAQDVASQPTMRLVDVMRLAADRDGIAREYATGFQATFETAAPSLTRARSAGLSWDDAVVETFLILLARTPDTHVIRRAGPAAAAEVSRLADAALAAGGTRSAAGRRAIAGMDRALRGPGHPANPGTTADLTAAGIFVVLLDGGWSAS